MALPRLDRLGDRADRLGTACPWSWLPGGAGGSGRPAGSRTAAFSMKVGSAVTCGEREGLPGQAGREVPRLLDGTGVVAGGELRLGRRGGLEGQGPLGGDSAQGLAAARQGGDAPG